MKKILLSAAACVLTGWALAQESPLWMRDCTISPDGTTIAFTYKGDIYTVPVSGGRAMQLTSHPAYDTAPVWSPDSKKIAFASDRMGSLDVFIVSREGGVPQRLTTHSGSETPIVFKDNGHVLFAAAIQPSAEDMQFPSGTFNQVYEVSVEGGRPRMFSSMPMEHISIRKDGKQWLYQDKKGYEDPWRKHHKSSIARDVWMYTPGTPGSYAKLTAFRGEDRDPVWAPDGESFYYLSEENGTFNVFKRRLGSASSTQITRHTVNPVRFLSIAENGTLCYGLDGEIYTLAPGKQPKKVKIEIMSDRLDRDVIRQVLQNGVSEMAVSPDGDEIAFGSHTLKVLATPGHSPGGLCFYCESEKAVFVGDTLFYCSVGRSDLPGGDTDRLMSSIKNKLFTLPDDTTAYPGHGPQTQIGFEKQHNPYVY